MLHDKKAQIVAALENAADEVKQQPIHEHHAMLTAAPAGVPGWLMQILQLLGPAVLQALQAWLNNIVPKPQPTPQPTPTPGTNP